MSQNDFSVANANGATVRADINSALQALASLSSGSSAPSTTYANMWWHDDTNDILKIRDEANTAWINAFSKVGTTWVPYSNGSILGTMANLNYASINQNVLMSAKHLAFATTSVSSGNPDFATSGNVVTITGTGDADTLGTVQAGFIGFIHYGVAVTITHNATSRILPTGASIVTAVGDCEIVLSLGSGNWRTLAYMRASGAALVGTAASQAQMESASSNTVFSTPGIQHHHPTHPKAYVSGRNTAGAWETPATGIAHNVSSITDDGVGLPVINFTTSFSGTKYAMGGSCQRTSTNSGLWPSIRVGANPTASSFSIACASDGASNTDPDYYGFIFVGDQ